CLSLACSKCEVQCVSLTSGARKRKVETGCFHLRSPQAKSKHTWSITTAQLMHDGAIFWSNLWIIKNLSIDFIEQYYIVNSE
ncbi:hypothetical protein Anapl_02001, partial [Anas platyrhynchos]